MRSNSLLGTIAIAVFAGAGGYWMAMRSTSASVEAATSAAASAASLAASAAAAAASVASERAAAVPGVSIPGTDSAGAANRATNPAESSVRWQQSGTLRIDGRLGHSRALRGGQSHVLFEIHGGDVVPRRAAPAHLSLVIDRSGSMKGPRMMSAIDAAVGAVWLLQENDAVSVVTFDSASKVVVPTTVVTSDARAKIEASIRAIDVGGDTCMSCGVDTALGLLAATPERLRRMIVLSDGEANRGSTTLLGFKLTTDRMRGEGTTMTTVGVGVTYNEKLLLDIAQSTNGRHHFVSDESSLGPVFKAEAEALMSTVASQAELEIDLGDGDLVKLYERSFRREGTKLRVPLGLVSRGERKIVLASVKLPSIGPLRARIVYHDLVSGEDVARDGSLEPTWVGTSSEVSALDPVVARWLRGSETADVVKEANASFARGNLDEALRKLDAQIAIVRADLDRIAATAPGDTESLAAIRSQLDTLQKTRGLYMAAARPVSGPMPVNPYMTDSGRKATKEAMGYAAREAAY